jgi:hypothetical protein
MIERFGADLILSDDNVHLAVLLSTKEVEGGSISTTK